MNTIFLASIVETPPVQATGTYGVFIYLHTVYSKYSIPRECVQAADELKEKNGGAWDVLRFPID